jgi:hypothetical protein
VRISVAFAFAFTSTLFGQSHVRLSEKTNRAFEAYVQAAKAATAAQAAAANSTTVQVLPFGGKMPLKVDDGLIHDWVGTATVPGVSVEKALAVFQDYDNYARIFAPEVVESKLVNRSGNRWSARLKLKRQNIVTVVLDTEYEVEYNPIGDGSWAISSRSTGIREVEDGNTLPAGTGNGYLWRLNAYWLLSPKSGGLYLQCRSISLSRDVPGALRWVIQPIVANVPRDSLRTTMEAAVRALK